MKTKSMIQMLGSGLLLLGVAMFAASINFESEALGTAISNQYDDFGVIFSSPNNPTQPDITTFSQNTTTGHLLADASVVGGLEINARFLEPINAISVIAYANPSFKVTMRAYDAANRLIGSVKSLGGNVNQGTIHLEGIGHTSKVT